MSADVPTPRQCRKAGAQGRKVSIDDGIQTKTITRWRWGTLSDHNSPYVAKRARLTSVTAVIGVLRG
jgi:hypothetical protein